MPDLTFFFTLPFSFSFIAIVIFIFSICHRQTKTPCPESYPLIGNIISLLRNRHRFHQWITDMLLQTPSSTYQVNSLFSLSSGICTANPVNVEHLAVSGFPNYIKGSLFHNCLYELLGDGIFNVDAHLWTMQRKIASHEFKTKSLKHFISEVVKSEISKDLMPFLSNACKENIVFDLQTVLCKFSFNNICNVAFGVNPSCMSNLPFAKAFDEATDISFSRYFSPIWKMKRFFNIGRERQLKEAVETINNFAMEVIKLKEREENSSSKVGKDQDLLSRFMGLSSDIEFQDQEHKRRFLRDIVISFILAGRDTVSTALTWFFWLISGNPRCAQLIYEELSSSSCIETSELGLRIFSFDELKKFHYLHAALSESMRLFPPVPLNARVAIDDDVFPDGTQVKKGWFAAYSAYAMGRMEKIWSEDCMEFKPERWLNSDGVYKLSDQFRYPVFHCGPRVCLGKELAYAQMKSIAAVMMYEFEILAIDHGGANAEKKMEPSSTLSPVLKMRGGLPIMLKRRTRQPRSNANDQLSIQ